MPNFAPLARAFPGCSPIYFHPMTQDQIKDLRGRAEALRRYL